MTAFIISWFAAIACALIAAWIVHQCVQAIRQHYADRRTFAQLEIDDPDLADRIARHRPELRRRR